MQEREITSRIRIDQLQPLLETTTDRVTAPMPAVTLEQLLQPEPPPPPEVQVTFRCTPRGTVIPEYVDFEVEETPLPAMRDGFDDVIDAAVDAAIDHEIYNVEIEAAIDAVTLRAPSPPRPRFMAVAVGLAAAFVTGVAVMFAL